MRVNAYTSSMIIHMKNFLGSLLFIFRLHLFIAYIILQTNQEWKQWVLALTFDKHHSDKLHNKSISLYELKQKAFLNHLCKATVSIWCHMGNM